MWQISFTNLKPTQSACYDLASDIPSTCLNSSPFISNVSSSFESIDTNLFANTSNYASPLNYNLQSIDQSSGSVNYVQDSNRLCMFILC